MTAVIDPTVPLTAPVNLRDLGGIEVAGGTLRAGVAIRADDLTTVTEEVADQLVAGGLRAVVDLRSTAELDLTGRGPLGTRAAVTYHHVPFLADIGAAADIDALDQHAFGHMYLRMYERASAQIVTALAVIAHAPGAVAFHCAAGQDRTGVLAASLLLALGANREAIVADYARTGPNSAAIMARIGPMMTPLLRRFGFDLDDAARAALREEFSDAPMREFLDGLVERHGDPLAPLHDAGLTEGLISRLRERALGE
ncbi:tyrosine-protein phosphatase [Georgenia subflava]|uniref:Protein-tyrosine-phosphatase n=1 Tax=Georgenia subflava TaxID=1622177 RepID=A0A6N7EE37_9MICO|nr:tyrosine-protein phosphatase [Georgenia subflava]MPV35601.1 protein-tyrosine-phosphatase [Georgenia subflava]